MIKKNKDSNKLNNNIFYIRLLNISYHLLDENNTPPGSLTK